jgi:hypothetical protein
MDVSEQRDSCTHPRITRKLRSTWRSEQDETLTKHAQG